MPVQVGGGLTNADALRATIAGGRRARRARHRGLHRRRLSRRGARELGDRVVVSVDVRGGQLAAAGWTEQTEIPADVVIERLGARGVRRFVYSSIERDGMLQGPDLDAVRKIAEVVRGSFIYSGGVVLAAGSEGAGAPAAGQPVRRDRRQGAVRAALRGWRGAAAARPPSSTPAEALMHYKRVIPCLDVSGGRVVKGVGFLDLRDAGDPVELARAL